MTQSPFPSEDRFAEQNSKEIDTAVNRSDSLRLHYLDGVRGLAALYVVLHHAYLQVNWVAGTNLPTILLALTQWLEYGSFSVVVFIVLSGYCLTLPVVKTGYVKGGFFGYIKRRAARIIPPYYAALGFSLLLPFLFPLLKQGVGTVWEGTSQYTISALLSHLLMLHNLKPGWAYKIDYPMWSVATEWQIYFAFPLLLLPIWRRWGLWAVLVSVWVIGFAPHWLPAHRLDYLKPWYLTMFTLGMTAAIVGFSPKSKLLRLRKQIPWGLVTLAISMALTAIVAWKDRQWLYTHEVITDPLVGMTTACLLIYCTRQLHDRQPSNWNLCLKFFNHPWLINLGAFSYSLYLIHAPIVAAIDLWLQSIQVSPSLRLLAAMAISVPISMGLAYLFYLVFEKRFISRRR